MPDDRLSAVLDETRRLVAARDKLIDRMRRGQSVTTIEFNAAQDKLAEGVPALLAALDAAVKQADEWAEGSYGTGSALDEDRGWVRAACAGKLREAITRELTGEDDRD